MRLMTSFRRWTVGSGIVAALVVTLPLLGMPTAAQAADMDEPGAAASDSKKTEYSPQSDDSDRPRDPSLLDKNAADAAVAKNKKAKAPVGPPFYEKWEFWAITGGIIVGGIAAIWAGSKIIHQMNGGDVRPCPMTYIGCFGGE